MSHPRPIVVPLPMITWLPIWHIAPIRVGLVTGRSSESTSLYGLPIKEYSSILVPRPTLVPGYKTVLEVSSLAGLLDGKADNFLNHESFVS